MYKQSINSFANQLIEDGIHDYGDLLKNKDMLIRFLTCAIENDNFKFLAENNIQELLEKQLHHCQLMNDDYMPFDSVREYGVRSSGEI